MPFRAASTCAAQGVAFLVVVAAGAAPIALLDLGCSSPNSSSEQGASPSDCSIRVNRFQELTVVDEAVLNDPRSRNREGGAWSFRHVVEQMTPPSTTTSAFLTEWLRSWQSEQRVNLFAVPSRPRLSTVVMCPWLKRTLANACNDDCTTCAARELEPAEAPFRLIGIVNRLDLHETEQRDEPGEGRLVYALTDGAADGATSPPLRMTVAFEYNLPSSGGRDVHYWAARWHALGRYTELGDQFRSELAGLTRDFTERGANLGGVGGSALGQLRTNEIELDWLWDLREFHLTETGLQLAPTTNTPDRSVNGSAELSAFAKANLSEVIAGRHRTPATLTGGAAVPENKWRLPGTSEELRVAFAKNTCDGCHQGEETPVDFNFHISPLRKGTDKLSRFMNDPAGGNDVLRAREATMRNALCPR